MAFRIFIGYWALPHRWCGQAIRCIPDNYQGMPLLSLAQHPRVPSAHSCLIRRRQIKGDKEVSKLLLEKTFANSVGVKVDMKINKLSILPILKKPNKKKARSKAVKKSHKSVKSKS